MRKWLFVVGLFWASGILLAEATANIVVHNDRWLTIDKGARDGVQVGMKGTVKALYKDPLEDYEINIGTFEVRKVAPQTAQVYVDNLGIGFKLEDSRIVVFDQDLVPPAEPPAKPKVEEKPADWYLEEGDKYYAAGEFELALQSYRKYLQFDADSLVVKEKINEAENQVANKKNRAEFEQNLLKADEQAGRGEIKYTVLYLIEALKAYPAGKEEVKKRILPLAAGHEQDVRRILAEKEADIKDIKDILADMLPPKAPPESRPIEPLKIPETVRPQETDRVKAKAESVYENQKGFSEALFHKNMVMVLIPAGPFTVGSSLEIGEADEKPSHQVILSECWISKYEVTFAQYDEYCQKTGATLPEDEGWGRGNRPVINVSWNDALDYCRWLSRETNLNFRLPTEAEWEKAAHGFYPWGNSPPDSRKANLADHQKWRRDNDPQADKRIDDGYAYTAPVGTYPEGASIYGVMDLAGNVWEWIQDWYDAFYYRISAVRDPQGPDSGVSRVVRGGSWANGPGLIRSANRSSEKPSSRLNIIGFRVVLSPR